LKTISYSDFYKLPFQHSAFPDELADLRFLRLLAPDKAVDPGIPLRLTYDIRSTDYTPIKHAEIIHFDTLSDKIYGLALAAEVLFSAVALQSLWATPRKSPPPFF